MEKQIYVVLGMPRSGTSAVARGLKALGIDLGEKLTPGNVAWNAKGFWEDSDIVYKINRKLVYTFKTESMNFSDDGKCFQDNRLDNIKQYAKSLLSKRMHNKACWGFKDPRTATVLPFWQHVFSGMRLDERYVIVLRNPLSSAESYKTLSGEDVECGLLLWLSHLIPAINGTKDKKRVLVSYELMLDNPEKQLERIKNTLAVPFASDQQDIEEYATSFLDNKLHRHVYGDMELDSHPAARVVPVCIKAYKLLYKIASEELNFADEAFTSAWQEIINEYETLKPVYAYIDKLRLRNKELKKQFRKINKSLPWKLVYPLRWIDNYFRNYRKDKREKRKLLKSYG